MEGYKHRIADQILADKLDAIGAVLIEGPKGCGKTTTAEQQAGSVLYMDDPDNSAQYRQMAQTNISILLRGETPRLIDEWQIAPQLWDAIRFEVDHRNKDGQFILTGSAVPPDAKKINHTGTGRYGWLTMRTMSLWESGESNGSVSLNDLFKHTGEVAGTNSIDIEQLAFLVCRGGWPRSTAKKTAKAALMQAVEYYEAIVRTQASIPTILADIAANETGDVSDETVNSYLNALRKIFVIEDMPAWNPNIRSKTAIRTADTRYFTDPSIACAALGLGPEDLVNDLNTFGLFFETLCVRDLRVYADALGGKVYHYRDKTGLECDAVIHLRNGSYGLIEVKLGGDKLIEEGASNLLTLNDKIDITKMKSPAFKMVLTGVGKYAYQRKDGIYVVPIGCLRD